ncbi:uncharacterized protein LACBIDRAFT_302470 [Laccaria bicolor S238N-H82]|uniref:Predicted protein n=1 Tax=Laccaria bicolor (strain S238N-H82 / ATCC MYA-4686) TaxID=486041 RepID=B0DHQ3_LACBS|nr:uncharacterized protein LACBIDRAFT_302470 [Laccaria bicolor S238N-H82]EDR05767.1 predicted protein [Laccaria bicolor S238N-H82]|eukprot:XP_001883443.1 predicted protein [Laccaria bicolor S238N-H82]
MGTGREVDRNVTRGIAKVGNWSSSEVEILYNSRIRGRGGNADGFRPNIAANELEEL